MRAWGRRRPRAAEWSELTASGIRSAWQSSNGRFTTRAPLAWANSHLQSVDPDRCWAAKEGLGPGTGTGTVSSQLSTATTTTVARVPAGSIG